MFDLKKLLSMGQREAMAYLISLQHAEDKANHSKVKQ